MFLRPLLRPVSAITSPTQLPPASSPAPVNVDIPQFSSHRNSCFAPSFPSLLVKHSPIGTHTSNVVQTDEAQYRPRHRASSKPANRKSELANCQRRPPRVLAAVCDGAKRFEIWFSRYLACLPALHSQASPYPSPSSEFFERLLEHINSSSCASLDYIYPNSSLSLNHNHNIFGPHIASPYLPTKAAPIIHLKQLSEEVVFPALHLFRSVSNRPPR